MNRLSLGHLALVLSWRPRFQHWPDALYTIRIRLDWRSFVICRTRPVARAA